MALITISQAYLCNRQTERNPQSAPKVFPAVPHAGRASHRLNYFLFADHPEAMAWQLE